MSWLAEEIRGLRAQKDGLEAFIKKKKTAGEKADQIEKEKEAAGRLNHRKSFSGTGNTGE